MTELKYIIGSLDDIQVGSEILVFDEVESTNDLARLHLSQNASEGLVIVADSQTRGRGRLGRSWFSEPGMGLYFSLVLKPHIHPTQFPKLTLMAGIAVAQAIRQFTQIKATLKWPNDVLLNKKKLCGILSEYHDNPQGVIIGIGINVNQSQFPEPLRDIATSLRIEKGEPVDRVGLLRSILTHLNTEYQSFLNDKPYPLAQKWTPLSEMFGKKVTLTHGAVKTPGIAVGLDNDGRLMVRAEDGHELTFDSGEVTLS